MKTLKQHLAELLVVLAIAAVLLGAGCSARPQANETKLQIDIHDSEWIEDYCKPEGRYWR